MVKRANSFNNQKLKMQEKYILVCWPESQILMEQVWFDECILINDENHLEEIGSSAYVVPENRYNELRLNSLENIIILSNCWEKVEIGYVSTFVKLDRTTNKVLSVTYHWDEEYGTDNPKVFRSFESLNTFINKLVDAKTKQK